MPRIEEAARTLDVARSVDVLVAGGGIAGVAAALASARNGAQTLLLEKECALGGLATLGMIIRYLPLCDGYGHQVIGGIGEELMRESQRYGVLKMHGPWYGLPEVWTGEGSVEARAKKRFEADYDAGPMIMTLEKLLQEAGVEIWYDTRLCSASSGGLTHVIVENKSGRLALEARAFVDATGDADLCFLAGEATESSDQNRRSGWYFSVRDDENPVLHPLTDPLYQPCLPGSRFYAGDRGSDVSAYVQDMHDMILENAQKQNAVPFLIPTIPLLRMTRRLLGRETLTEANLGQWRTDAVALTGDWRKPAPVYAIGLAHLQGVKSANLFAAGRCISSAGDAWDVTRVIPTCAATGEAAGLAAAMWAQTGTVDVPALQNSLKAAGAILDPDLLQNQ
ncbi:MAG: FAD-dependent oxidoreductase [bacterium]|nr:FAD-dependent oxidoreductase [bacterium]